jgi:hypothetical protein
LLSSVSDRQAPLLAACSAAEVDADDAASSEDELSVRPSDVKGSLAAGETKAVEYTGASKYVALRLELAANAEVDLQVTSETGAPSIYLLKSDFGTLERATGIAGATGARIAKSVRSAGTYYLAFREASGRPASFTARFLGPQVVACATDAQCGASALCVFDHCATVDTTTKDTASLNGFAGSAIGHVQVGYGASDEVHLAYLETTLPDYRFIDYGLWPGRFGYRNKSKSFSLQRTLGMPPTLVSLYEDARGDEQVSFRIGEEAENGPTYGITAGGFDAIGFARDPGGRDWVAYAQTTSDQTTTNVYIHQRQRPGNWSLAEQVASFSRTSFDHRIAIHPRRDGAADILLAGSLGAGSYLLHRNAADGSWTKKSAGFVRSGSGPMVDVIHGGSGRTHVLTAQKDDFTFAAQYTELGDDGIARSRDLGSVTSRTSTTPFRDIGVDAAGNVYILKVVDDLTYRNASVLRIDAHKNVVERPLARSRRSYPDIYSLGVSPRGELALAAASPGRISVTRWRPTP